MGTTNACSQDPRVHGARYYRFEDAAGRVHLVDSIDSVPTALRARATCIQYTEEPSPLSSVLVQQSPQTYRAFGLGFAAALLVSFVFWRLPGSLRWFFKLAIVGGLVVLLASAYFGWLRRSTGQSSATLSDPRAIIDDVKQAVSKMNAQMAAQQAELKEIEQAK